MSKRYGSISWNVESVIADTTADPDTLPDVITVEGTVRFSPRVPVVHYPNLSVHPEDVIAYVEDSKLVLNEEQTVTLLASVDGNASPSSWTYDVTFDLYTLEGASVRIPAGRISVFPDIQMSLSLALTTEAGVPSGSFTAGPYVWASPNEPEKLEEGTWWLDTTTGDLKEWRE